MKLLRIIEIILLYPYQKYEFKINRKFALAIVLTILGTITFIYWNLWLVKAPFLFKWFFNLLSVNKTQVAINIFAGILLVRSLIKEKLEK